MGLLDALKKRGTNYLTGPNFQAMADNAPVGSVGAPGGLLAPPPAKAPGNPLRGLLAASSFAPGIGDAAGLMSDALMYYDDPESRTPGNFALSALGMLPFVPSLGIVSPDLAKTLKTRLNIPDDSVLREAAANTPNAQITNDGLLMRVMRNQKPDQSLAESVRGGVFYLPEGAAQAKHYSTGKAGYGGSERIAGETLIKNPLVGKGGTGGKAPQTAYDSLIGKGAYESMRNDALKSFGRYGAPAYEKVEKVEEFLNQYAPELSGMGDYIIQNSKEGNQLAYALQEAAVASAARRAGHDAIVGYSKGKQGNFISEVFDVRERSYPDKFGSPADVWEDYR